jgi:hypothetical protein
VGTNAHKKCKGSDGVLQWTTWIIHEPKRKCRQSGSKKHCSEGVYTGLHLADIEKNVKEAQALNNEKRGTEGADVANAMLTWKCKERDWLKGSKEKNF